MTHYVGSSIRSKKTGTGVRFKPKEEMPGLSTLSMYLAGSVSIEDLVERSAKQIIKMFDLDTCRIILLEPDGHFYCKVAYTRLIDLVYFHTALESTEAEKIYDRLLEKSDRLNTSFSNRQFTKVDNQILGIEYSSESWVVPLRVETEKLGVLIIGRSGPTWSDTKHELNQSFVEIISEQFSNAIYRTQVNHRFEYKPIETVIALSRTLETRDSLSAMHSRRIAFLAELMAKCYGMTDRETRELNWAALLHDIGKIGVEDRILYKEGPLTSEEWVVMKTHPEIGAHIVRGVSGLENIAPFILGHHERYDGSGYPQGLSGETISLGARILAVVDTYAAMTEGRPYRPARPHQEALVEIEKGAGSRYDPDVAEKFIKIFELEGMQSQLSPSVVAT